MAFFDKLGKKLEGMVQDAHEYTSDLIEVNRLNGNIRSEREAIDGLQKKIGVAMHKRFQGGESVPDDIRPELEEITARLEKIVGLETRVEEARRNARSEQAVAADRAAEADAAGPVIAREWPDEETGDRTERAPAVPLHAEEPLMARGPSGADAWRDDADSSGSATPTEADIVNEQSERPLQAAAGDPNAEPDSAPRRFCVNCGAPLVAGKPFCGNCGHRND